MTPDTASIRPPWPDEMPRLKQFLKGSMRESATDTYLKVLCDAHPERIVGACALAVHANGEKESYAKLFLRLRPRQREAGMAEKLIQSSIDDARRRDVHRIQVELNSGDPLRAIFESQGFKSIKTEEVWKIEMRAMRDRLEKLAGKLGSRADWTIRCPEASDLPKLIQLGENYHFRQSPDIRFDGKMDRPGTHYAREISSVVEIEGSIQAALLLKASTGLNFHVDLRMVAPEWMHESGRLNFALLQYSTAKVIKAGYETTTMTVNLNRDRETRNLAKRTGGQKLLCVDLLTLNCETG